MSVSGRPDPKLALSQVETEALRTFRTRMNRPAVSDAASATLGRAFFQVIARSDLKPAAEVAGEDGKGAAIGTLLAEIGAADMAGLNRLLTTLHARLTTNPAAWRRLQVAGVPQAVISRRLQLAGREPDPNLAPDPAL